MMSVRKALARMALAICCGAAGSLAQAAAKYHVGIVTGTVSQGNSVLNITAGTSMLVSYVDAVDATDTSSANAVIASGSATSVSIYKSLITPASGRVLVGGTVVYNIQVANTGSGSLATVTLADTFDGA